MTYQEFMSKKDVSPKIQAIESILKRQAERKIIEEEDRAKLRIEQENSLRQQEEFKDAGPLKLAQDFYAGKRSVAGPYVSERVVAKQKGTVLPQDNRIDALMDVIPEVNNYKTPADFEKPFVPANKPTIDVSTIKNTNNTPIVQPIQTQRFDNAVIEGQDFKSNLEGFARSLASVDRKDIPLYGSGIEAAEAIKLGSAAIKFEKGNASQEEIKLLSDYYEEIEKNIELNKNKGYVTGEIIKGSARFMSELGIVALTEFFTGSAAPTGDAYVLAEVGKLGARKTLTKYAENKAFRLALNNAVKNTVKREAITLSKQMALTAPMHVTSGAGQRLVGVYDLESGEVIEEGQPISTATVNSLTGYAVELLTERGGGVSGKILGALSSPVKKVVVKTSIYNALKRALPKATENQLTQIIRKAGWNGVMGEWFEERDADILNDILYRVGLGDQKFEGLTLDDVTTEIVAFSIMGGGVNVGTNLYSNYIDGVSNRPTKGVSVETTAKQEGTQTRRSNINLRKPVSQKGVTIQKIIEKKKKESSNSILESVKNKKAKSNVADSPVSEELVSVKEPAVERDSNASPMDTSVKKPVRKIDTVRKEAPVEDVTTSSSSIDTDVVRDVPITRDVPVVSDITDKTIKNHRNEQSYVDAKLDDVLYLNKNGVNVDFNTAKESFDNGDIVIHRDGKKGWIETVKSGREFDTFKKNDEFIVVNQANVEQLKNDWNTVNSTPVIKTIPRPESKGKTLDNIIKKKRMKTYADYVKKSKENEKKKPKVKRETPAEIRERLRLEKARMSGDQISSKTLKIEKVNVEETKEPVYPKNGSSYEIGEYYKKKDIWDAKKNKRKPVKVKQSAVQESETSKIVKEYNSIVDSDKVSSEGPSVEDLTRMTELENKYEELTGRSLIVDETSELNIENASKDRYPESEYRKDDEWNEVMYRRSKSKSSNISTFETRPLSGTSRSIIDINTGRQRFSLVQELLDIVDSFGLKIDVTKRGVAGSLMKDIIALDSVTDMITMAHELTHNIERNTNVMEQLLESEDSEAIKAELYKSYKKYYEFKPKDIDVVDSREIYREGLSEFVGRYLHNPSKFGKEFPRLTDRIINGNGTDGKISKMYNKLNELLYIYQNISPIKQEEAHSGTGIVREKKKIKSRFISRRGRARTNLIDERHPLRIIDKLVSRINPLKDAFVVDKDGISLEMIASQRNTVMGLSVEAFNKNNSNTRFMSFEKGEAGELKELLPFSIGEVLDEIYQNGDLISYGTYRENRDQLRDFRTLQDFKTELFELDRELENETDKDNIKELTKKIKSKEERVKVFEGRIEHHRKTGAELEDIVAEGDSKFGKYNERVDKIFDSILELNILSGSISREHAEGLRAREGYNPTAKETYSDVEIFFTGSGKRSAITNEMRERLGFDGVNKNSLETLPLKFAATMANYQASSLYNNLYEKFGDSLFIEDGGSKNIDEPYYYVYKKDGKRTAFHVKEKILGDSIESVLGRTPDYTLVENWARGAAQFMTRATTMYNPYFSFGKNIFLDIPTSAVFTRTKYTPIASQAGRYGRQVTDSDFNEKIKLYNNEYALLGGSDHGLYNVSEERKTGKSVLEKISRRNDSQIKKSARYLGKAVEDVLGAPEQFTRKEEFIRARLNGDSVAEAYEKSRLVSGAFHRKGLVSKRITRLASFSNAMIQLSEQMMETLRTPYMRKRMVGVTILSSMLSLSRYLLLISRLDKALAGGDDDEIDSAYEEIYQQLDKTTYEKVNFAALGDELKIASNPIFSAPGNLVGISMLQRRIPEYKVQYGDIAYEALTSMVPSQVVPEVDSPDDFFRSSFGRIVGSNPIGGITASLAGYRTFPVFTDLESVQLQKGDPGTRFKEDTNSLAIIISQMFKSAGVDVISPLKVEGVIRSLGTGILHGSDAVGAAIMTDKMKDELGLIDKDLKYLLLKNPLKGSLYQRDEILVGETRNKIYEMSNILEANKAEGQLTIDAFKKKVDDPSELSSKDQRIFNNALAIVDKSKEELKINRKIKDALKVVKAYQLRDKELPPKFTNALQKFILAKDSGEFSNFTREEYDMILDMAKYSNDLKNIKWSTIKDK